MSDNVYNMEHIIRLGVYTVEAADIIGEVVTWMAQQNFESYHQYPFDSKHGTFGTINKTAYVIVLPGGELALERYSNDISDEELLLYLKNSFKAYLARLEAMASLKSSYLFSDNCLSGADNRKKIDEAIKNCNVLVKFFSGEEITDEDRRKMIGRQYNAFEEIELNKLLDELYINGISWGKNPNRSKIRKAMLKVEKDF